ncbi:Stk1 family PASTA domain-containing Ser/Thr kinase [Leucobacter aridicollis]|uniref:Stk1 family PASTA domain-containing Ser/Thr kinase n=1 Tax=Leucobacter aridicollis TaxID=283878 RepID=UPI00210692E0|nr:Stk1 family PASTA domain-containing Ser/Thr kinase [Leucobacter aridicollis]
MTPATIDPLIGQTLDARYVIRSRIARGGMAMVYLAHDLRLERKVAVKVMHEHLAEDADFTRRFDREARSAARLSHTNLVNVFDQGQDLGRVYLVMEYLPSITLRELLKKQQRLTLDQSLEIGEAVLAGLAAAHNAGIVHRDLKPENVLLVDDGRIKLGDFGLARAVSANTTTGQALLGTIAYLSPELVTRGVAGERSDLYAFGIMLYEMITGSQPFTGEQPMQIAYQHAHSDVPAPSESGDVSTPALDSFVVWLTQRDPELRPANAGEALLHMRELRNDPYGMPEALATAVLPIGQGPGDTTVLPGNAFDDAATTRLTPSTTVLNGVEQAALQAGTRDAAVAPAAAATSTDRAHAQGVRRARRGRTMALIVTALAVATGAGAFWFGQGPGSAVTVPEVSGMTVADAQAELEALDLTVAVTDCSSLEVEVGLASAVTPGPGSRLDRGSEVTLCKSTGPEMLAVPTLVGLQLDDATALISDSKFTFGEVSDTRFSDTPEGQVLAALDADDAEIGSTFPERGTINLIVSAGQPPSVNGLTVDQATSVLSKSELTVDSAHNTEVISDDVPKGQVVAVNWTTDPVRPGDTVGLQISTGPELFEIPDVSGLGLQEAMDTLAGAGFSPSTLVPEALRGFAKATGTNPAAGERVEAGTEIRITSQLSL